MKNNEQPLSLKHPSASSGMEEKIGVRLFVWVGAIAIAWAGILLVKLSFEQGWITPPMRIAMGVLLGIAFLAAGEWFHQRTARLAQGLSASGIAVLYASFLAAHRLYELISSPVAFSLLSVTTLIAVLLSLRRGSITAVIGLLGGFLTPLWISSPEPSATPLFAYLFLLQTGLWFVSRYRKSEILAFLTLVGSSLWTFAWIVLEFQSHDALILNSYIVLSLISYLMVMQAYRRESILRKEATARLTWAVAISTLTQLSILMVAHHFVAQQWIFLAAHTTLILLLARKMGRYDRMPWLSAGVIAFLLTSRALYPAQDFVLTTFALSFLISAGAYVSAWGADRPSRWAALSVATAILYFLIACLGSTIADDNLPWGALSLFCGALYVAGTIPVIRTRSRLRESYQFTAAMAIGATAFLCFAVPLELKHEWLAVAWAMEAAAILWIESRLRVPALRTISLVIATLVVLRLLIPTGFHYEWYWMLYSYGIPIFAFGWAALLASRNQYRQLSSTFQWLAILSALAYSTFTVRLAFHSQIWASNFTLAECGVLTLAWLLLAALSSLAGKKYEHKGFGQAAYVLLAASILQSLMMQATNLNPLWNALSVGTTPIFNQLLPAYGIPAMGLIATGFLMSSRRKDRWATICQLTGALFLLLLVTTEIRQFFHGHLLHHGFISMFEYSAYVTGWLFLGLLMLLTTRFFWSDVLLWGGRILTGLAATATLFLFVENPLWTSFDVGGTPLWNLLLLLYGLPAALMSFISYERRSSGDRYLSAFLETMGILLLFFLLNMEVRQFFHGNYLNIGDTSTLEKYSYSLAWILFSLLLLAIGMFRNRLVIRYYSLGLMLAAIGKVFLYDTGQLTDLYRFFSLIGLGLSLFFVAYLYQRFLFRKELQHE